MVELWALCGLVLAGASVISNDAVQTLGTFMASNKQTAWWKLWAAASAVLVTTVVYSWFAYNGDISFGRLDKIPYVQVEWYHALAPAVLLLLTRFGIPVSTTFLVLSVFASTVVFEKMLVKSMLGYAIAAVVAYGFWMALSKFLDEKKKVDSSHEKWSNPLISNFIVIRLIISDLLRPFKTFAQAKWINQYVKEVRVGF